jgi:hypothetical protein
MKTLTRLLAVIAFLPALAVLLLSLAGGVGVWVVKEPVTTKATRIFERVESGLDIADRGLDHARTSLEKAAERLENAKEDQLKIAQEPQSARRRLARTLQRTVAPELSEAHETLHTVAEAAVVVNSILEDLGSFPFLSESGMDTDQLSQMNSSLSTVESTAWELTRILGEPASESDSDEVGQRVSRIEQALKALLGLVARYETQVQQVRERVAQLKSKTLPRITPAAVVVSVICFWVALSQICILTRACSWWRRAGLVTPGAT